MTDYLLVAHQTAEAPELRECVTGILSADPAAGFSVLVPESPVQHLLVWDEAESHAQAVEAASLLADILRSMGGRVEAVATRGGSPLAAIGDSLREHPGIGAIIISTFRPGLSRWLGLDLVAQARRTFGLPIIHVIAQGTPRRTPQGNYPESAPESSTPDVARVEPALAAQDEVPDENGLLGMNLRSALGHNPMLLESYVAFEAALSSASGLNEELQQLVRLRVALRLQSDYLWQDAVCRARLLGLSDDRIFAVEHWQASERVHFSELERIVLSFVDADLRGKGASATVLRELRELLPPSALIGLLSLVGFARLTGELAANLDAAPDGPFVGWRLY